MAKLTYKQRERQRREQEILKTAARMIRERGYAQLNMDDLAEEVGISKPTLYQHFEGKEDMVVKTMLHAIVEMEDHMHTLEGTALEKLEAIMRNMLETHSSPDGASVSIATGQVLPTLQQHHVQLVEVQTRVTQALYALVAEAKEAGDIREDIPAVVVIGAMFSLLPVLEGPHIMRDYSHNKAEIIESVLSLWRRGLQS